VKNSRGSSPPPQHFVPANIARKFNPRAAIPSLQFARLSKALAAFAAIVFLFLAGCSKKPLTRSQVHVISGEITAAAQDVTSRRPDITIRPDFRPVAGVPKGQGPADSISISLDDASHTDALREAFREIARRHNLSLAEATSNGVVRFNFTFAGSRTHIVYVETPAVARSRASALPSARGSGSGPELAIILDDLGNDRAAADALLALPFPLTISVIPHLPLSEAIADEAYRRGDQVILHLPMQAQVADADSESIELKVGMNAEQVRTTLDGMLETVPHAVGANNHQGSRATSDPALMGELMPALHAHGLFFIDSRTTASTVAYDAAEQASVPAASRKVFLDDMPERNAILKQLDLAAKDAIQNGSAIAIGHPHPETIAALSEAVPRLEARGVHLVFASDLVH
jgi:polysaccharide deacetylase 2 family uncharacterized protein YibQ